MISTIFDFYNEKEILDAKEIVWQLAGSAGLSVTSDEALKKIKNRQSEGTKRRSAEDVYSIYATFISEKATLPKLYAQTHLTSRPSKNMS